MPSFPRVAWIAVSLLTPAAALADFDPNLHVDPNVKDCSVSFSSGLTQDAFHRFAREFGSVSAFKQVAPPTLLGQWGFAVDVQRLSFSVEEKSAAWNDTFVHPDSSHELGSDKAFPMLRLRMGVTDDLDVGVFYTRNPEANYGWLGVEAKWALLRQSEEMPIALAVRGAYTKTLYVTDMNMHALTADVSAGHTFWRFLTPYVGVGTDAVFVRETSKAVDLKDEAILVPHAMAGVSARYWHVALGFEAQYGAIASYQAQVSAVF